jgi:hypothetical protein
MPDDIGVSSSKSDLLAKPSSSFVNFDSIYMEGYYIPGDGGGGRLFWLDGFILKGNTTANSKIITNVSDATQIRPGIKIRGPGVPGVRIVGVSGTTVTLSVAATVTATNADFVAEADGGLVFRPNDVLPDSPGRWLRIVGNHRNYDPLWFGAKGDGRNPSLPVTIMASSNVLTVGSPLFSLSDVGKNIGVAGAGAAGATLSGTIQGFTSTTQVTLSVAASTSLSGVSKVVTFGTLDTAAIQETIDAAIAAGVGYEASCGDFPVGPILGNGSSYVPPAPNEDPGQIPAVTAFRGQGRSPFLCRYIACPGQFPDPIKHINAVLTFRNVAGVTVSGFAIDANNEADVCGDFAWIGGTAPTIIEAPSCANEFTNLWGQGARRTGWNMNQAADSKLSSITYRGGTASVGLSLLLAGGGIWADNIFLSTGRLLIACQNAGLQNCGFFHGLEITGASNNYINLGATHLYPYTPRRTAALGTALVNPFQTKSGSKTVKVTMFNHGFKDGEHIQVDSAATVGGINLNNTDSVSKLGTTPELVVKLLDPSDPDYANRLDIFTVEAPTPATADAVGGGTVDIIGRGKTIISTVPVPASGARVFTLIGGWLNVMGTKGQKYFAGRWMVGAKFIGTRFGNNAADPSNSDIYFDTSNWTTAGVSGSLPLFDFDRCTFAAGPPVDAPLDSVDPPVVVPKKVLVNLNDYMDANGEIVPALRHHGALQFPDLSLDDPFQIGARWLWPDSAGHLRLKSTVGAPAVDSDGNILMERQAGNAAPINVVTPSHLGAEFADGSNSRLWYAYNTTSGSWTEYARRSQNAASPISTALPSQSGQIYVDMAAGRSYVAYDTANTAWDIIPRTLSGSEVKSWGLIANGTSLSEPVTVNGAVLGDHATAAMSISLQGLTMTAYVSAANTVTVVLANLTGAPVTLGSGTLTARVMRT